MAQAPSGLREARNDERLWDLQLGGGQSVAPTVRTRRPCAPTSGSRLSSVGRTGGRAPPSRRRGGVSTSGAARRRAPPDRLAGRAGRVPPRGTHPVRRAQIRRRACDRPGLGHDQWATSGHSDGTATTAAVRISCSASGRASGPVNRQRLPLPRSACAASSARAGPVATTRNVNPACRRRRAARRAPSRW